VASGTDPIFQGEERVDRTTPRTTLLFQFFLFPLLIVIASVGVFLLFGAIGGAERNPQELLDAVVSGGENVQKQAVQDLAVRIVEERRKVDQGRLKAAEAFYAAPSFQTRLLQAFEGAIRESRGPEREQALAVCLGAVGQPAFVPALTGGLALTRDPAVRRASAMALGAIPGDASIEPLVAALKDPDDAVRSFAIQGLSQRKGAAVLAALHAALDDGNDLVRMNAAAALAHLKDPAGKALIASMLDPAWVDTHVVKASSGTGANDPDLRRSARVNALSNGLRGAWALRADDLKPLIEALTRDADTEVSALARQVLDQWGSPP
jgi:HEAT repeat protein